MPHSEMLFQHAQAEAPPWPSTTDSVKHTLYRYFRRRKMTAILGVGGLANSVSFKRAQWPGLEEREYRISQGHDAAAALVIDGVTVAAAAEERFNRQKHTGDLPVGAT